MKRSGVRSIILPIRGLLKQINNPGFVELLEWVFYGPTYFMVIRPL